ncbi:MAG: hypothetical protein OEW29_10865, partial [Acidimicrobiia bacterium]|nr:hypothetical protein [Acidimicrobiia bacterium]
MSLALALAASGCAGGDAATPAPAVTSTTPPPPPVVELGTVPVTDDLHRFVVGPFDAAAEALTGPGTARAAPADGAHRCDAGSSPSGGEGSSGGPRLRSLPPGAALAVELGVPGYRHAGGTFVPLDDATPDDPHTCAEAAAHGGMEGSGPGVATDPDPRTASPDPVLAALAARDGVVDIQPI